MLNRKIPVKLVKINLSKHTKQFSLWQLVLFIAIFAGVGGYFIYHSLAVVTCACGGGGTPPSTPVSLTANTFDDTEIDLSWSASTSSYGVSGYHVYRNGSLIDTTTANSYYSAGLASATSYSYYVTAYNAYGASGASNSAAGQTYSTTPPSAPANFTAHVTSATTVNLNWNASTPGQVPIKEYDIFEGYPANTADDTGQANVSGKLIGSTTNNYYQVSGLSASTSYVFYAVAVDKTTNNSLTSDLAVARTNAAGFGIDVSLTSSAYNIANGQIIGLVWSSAGSGLACSKTSNPDTDVTDPSWSGAAASNTTGSQWIYPPNATSDYITYYYELACTNGTSTAMSGVAVTVAPAPNTSTTSTFQAQALTTDDSALSGDGTHIGANYVNPFRALTMFTRSRIDAGVDYGGHGWVYPIGSGVIEAYSNKSGWPPGHFISYKLTSGPAAGLWVYVAEYCRLNKALHGPSNGNPGSSVTSSTPLCKAYGRPGRTTWGIETGWAVRTQNSTNAVAFANGYGNPKVCVNGGASPYGKNFSRLMWAISPSIAGDRGFSSKNCSQPAISNPPFYKWSP